MMKNIHSVLRRKKSRLSTSQKKFLLVFGIPTFLLYVYICIVPMMESVRNSFTEWNGYGDKEWIGLSNYAHIIKDNVFAQSVWHDMYLVIFKEIMGVTLALLFAIALTRIRLKKTEKIFLRFLYYIPNMLSVIVILMVWRFFFNLNMFDELLKVLHLNISAPNGWMTDYPLPIIGFVASWCGIGSFMIIFIAAINNVSQEIYEAAEIDGAGQWGQLWHITIPDILSQVRYVIVTILTSSLAANLNLVLPFTNGGPSNRTMVMGLYVYNAAYVDYKVGYANAAAVLLMMISICLAALVNWAVMRKGD